MTSIIIYEYHYAITLLMDLFAIYIGDTERDQIV